MGDADMAGREKKKRRSGSIFRSERCGHDFQDHQQQHDKNGGGGGEGGSGQCDCEGFHFSHPLRFVFGFKFGGPRSSSARVEQMGAGSLTKTQISTQ